jgi:hypothetical protein
MEGIRGRGPDGKVIAFVDHPQPSDDGGAVAVVIWTERNEAVRGVDSIQRRVVARREGNLVYRNANGRRLVAIRDRPGREGSGLARVPGELTILMCPEKEVSY